MNEYELTPEGARDLARDPRGVRAAFQAEHGEDQGDAMFLMIRFVQGREKRELPAATEEEYEFLATEFAKTLASVALFNLVLKGFAYVDVIEGEDGKPELGFQVTGDGAEAIRFAKRGEE